MIRQIIPAFLLFVSFFFQKEAEGQVPVNIPDYLTEKLSKYCAAVPWEDIFLHTDRNEYIAGEDMWFKAYLTDRLHGSPTARSKIVYVEIINPLDIPVVQKRIKIDNGLGPGYIYLPDSLTTGRYTVRAYTNLMKNFLPETCFSKDIFIYNALKGKVLKGKSLLSDSASDNTVISNAQNTSVTLKVNNLRTDSLEIIINTTDDYRYSNSNLCYLLIHTHGIINRISQVRFRTNKGRVAISKEYLTPGVNHITIFNSFARPVAERFIYTPITSDQNISITSPGVCGKRDKITLEIEFPAEIDSSFESASLSIAVAPSTDNDETFDLADFMVFGTEFGILPGKIRNSKLSEISPEFIDSCLLNFRSRWIDWNKILSNERPVLRYGIEDEYHFISGKLTNLSTQIGDSFKNVIISVPGKEAVFQYATTNRQGKFTFAVPIIESVNDLVIQPVEANHNTGIQIESTFSEKYATSGNHTVSSGLVVSSYIQKWSSNYQVSKIYGSSYLKLPEPVTDTISKQKRFYGKPDIELVMDDYIKLPVMSEVFFELLPGVFLKNRRSVWEISIADPETNRIYDEPPLLFVDGIVINDASIIANMDPELVEKIDVIKERYLVGDFLFFGIVNVINRAGDFSNVTLPEYAVRLPYRITEPVNTFSSPDYSTAETKQRRTPDLRNTMYWNPSIRPEHDDKATIEFWSSDYSCNYIIDIQGITDNGTRISLKKKLTVR